MLDFLKNRPMLLAAVISSVISVTILQSEVALFILSLIILGIIFWLIYKRVKPELIFATILILAVTVSGFLTTVKAHYLEKYDKLLCKGEFIVVSEPVNHGIFYSVILETAESDILKSGEKIGVSYSNAVLEYSERINAQIKLSKYGEGQRKNSFYAEGEFLSGYLKSVEKNGQYDQVLFAVKKVREYIKTTVFKNFKPEEAATVMALVAGDKSYFSERFYSNVKSAGVAHVMVVSGMHLSVIVSMFLYIFKRIFYNRFLKAVCMLFVTIGVMAICGFTMSILRAGITYILVAIALALDRESTGENTLGFAVVLILISNPYTIFSVAFELSVLSTFAILVVSIPITEYINERLVKNKILMGMISSAVISVSTMMFTAPVAIYYFGYISTVSIITNLLIGTAASFIMIFTIIGLIFPILSELFLFIAEMITSYVNGVINYFGELPFSTKECKKWTMIFPIFLIITVLSGLVACKINKNMLKLKEISEVRIKEGGNGKYAADFGAGIKERDKKSDQEYIHIIRK